MSPRRLITRALTTMLGVLAFTAAPALASPPETPQVSVQTPVHATESTFHGILNPEKEGGPGTFESGTYQFLYKQGASCVAGTRIPASPAISLGGGKEEVSQTAKGLKANTQYTVCLMARNGTVGEEALSAPVSFTTATPPEKPETKLATGVTAGGAVLHGVLNPKAEAETGWYFAYSTGAQCTSGGTGGGESAREAPAKVKAVSVEKEVTGLQPNRTYKFCLVATNNTEEPIAGNELALKTLPMVPVIGALQASPVSSTAATLTAQINPNNEPTKYTFEYSTQETGGVLEGTIVKVPGAGELEGFPEQPASVNLSGLKAGETYFYRVVAENEQSKGTPSASAVGSFTTVPAPTTGPVTAITGTTATFSGHIAPLNPTVASSYRFSYRVGGGGCTGEHATSPVEVGTGAGTEVAAGAEVTGLQPHAEYTVCLLVESGSNLAEGAPVHFTTAAVPPRIESESVSGVTATEATLEAKVNPNNQEVAYRFEYATSEALTGATTVPGAAPLTGHEPQTATIPALTGLKVGETYFYRVVIENTATKEVVDGAVRMVTPAGPPLLHSGEALSITSTTATIPATVNPAGTETTYLLAYITQAGYEAALGKGEDPFALSKSTALTGAGSGYETQSTPVPLGELSPATTYRYRLTATNGLGAVTVTGVFTTAPATLPLASTGAVEALSQSSVTLTGTVDPRGLQAAAQFEFGTTPYQGALVPATVTSGTEPWRITARLEGDLQPATTYFYRTVATGSQGTAFGALSSFTTPGYPATFAPASLPALIPYTTIAQLEAKEPKPSTTKPLTNAQRLARALRACRAKHNRHRRTVCEHQAHRRYRTANRATHATRRANP